ncbi:MAG: flagellar hook-length control protein FliK [Rickettsiaceae bacterium H1]|nr:flagellar hook-length control protein FliK [Rickettsiaceae bacterium H1]
MNGATSLNSVPESHFEAKRNINQNELLLDFTKYIKEIDKENNKNIILPYDFQHNANDFSPEKNELYDKQTPNKINSITFSEENNNRLTETDQVNNPEPIITGDLEQNSDKSSHTNENLIDKKELNSAQPQGRIANQCNKELIKNINKNSNKISFVLEPEELGKVDIEINFVRKSISIIAEYDLVKQILRQNINLLEKNLIGTGMNNINFSFGTSRNRNQEYKKYDEISSIKVDFDGLLNILI